ncbi:hypothetical protein K438DRAFT_1787456 [Mycena galopus ATCC 62051]|nr:hypothetical protein K438DRAFT_1787456 [Mycena galopus ATCC 62051]
MPTHPSNVSNTVLQYTVIAANALQDRGKAAQIPFVDTVCSLTLAVVSLIQNTTSQKEQCLQMVEDIHLVLCALIGLCANSDNIASPQLLEHIALYHTLQKFHACLKAQQELGNLKRLFKQGEITQQMNICKQELSKACNMFRMNYGASGPSALVEAKINTEQRHQELLELISTQTESVEAVSSIIVQHFQQCGQCLLVLDNFETPWEHTNSRSNVEDFLSTLTEVPNLALLASPVVINSVLGLLILH